MVLVGETGVFGENLIPVPPRQPHVAHRMDWD
jgi:hypothetical protein